MTFSDRAQSDLEDIWIFSARSWDAAQADDYVAAVVTALERAAIDPRRLRRSPVGAYRIVTCRSHRAYVRLVEDGVFVVRILHTSMDEAGHLP